ncbi:MAG: hypothetical protein JSW20_09000 [Nitrospiraceae bacterium]|nr:MAG: hypothetical protein JSW20_09000 [Nitrospiraceae bacterium]
MDLDIRIGNNSLPVDIKNPFRFDISAVMNDIIEFGNKNKVALESYELDKLITRMIKGVAGCEAGCPSDAHNVVRQGFGNFKLEYVEGGILTAVQHLENSRELEIKIFPDF